MHTHEVIFPEVLYVGLPFKIKRSLGKMTIFCPSRSGFYTQTHTLARACDLEQKITKWYSQVLQLQRH